jgi:signal transduction histidine kinase
VDSKIKILMIDDDEEDFIITKDLVKEIGHDKYDISWTQSYKEGLKLIRENTHDVFLIDYRLGPDNGLELIREALKVNSDIPLILLTGQNDIEIDKQAVKAGASDYLVKGNISPAQLDRAIRYSIEHAKNMSQIKQLNVGLEKRVADRTLILEESIEELQKTKTELNTALNREKELGELKSRFVSMASHEFRTPLTTMLSSLSLIKRYGELNEIEKQGKHIDKISSSIRNLTEILNDFLSIGKLEEGKVIEVPEEFNLKAYISEVISDMQQTAKRDQKIIYTHNGNENAVLDKKLLQNILFNLISNAIKFSPEGETIIVDSEINKSFIKVSVHDKGIGISKKDQRHLFERFFRGHNATHIQGTGLGLHIVAKYVELMNGTISVSSEENKGTTFTINFPFILS